MADTFSISIVTADGANLIAQATSSNQIVMVDALSCTLAATDAADLASKTASWYDGVAGTIESSSATYNVAKVVAKFGNAGANPQAVKSVALRAKLANQADSAAVIIAAMSDENSEIVLPSSSSVAQVERVIFNFAVNADDQTETVYADGATIADLARFVSMYKAGDPTQGENQSVKGDKTFENDVSFGDDVTIAGYCYAKKIQMDKYQVGDPSPWIQISGSVNESWIRIENSSIKMTDNYNQQMITINASGIVDIGGRLTVHGDIKADTTNHVAEFYDCDVEHNLSVQALTGLEPAWVDNKLKIKPGGIVCAWGGSFTSVSTDVLASDEFEINSNTVTVAIWECDSGKWADSQVYLPHGLYVALSSYDATAGSSHGPIFLIMTESLPYNGT